MRVKIEQKASVVLAFCIPFIVIESDFDKPMQLTVAADGLLDGVMLLPLYLPRVLQTRLPAFSWRLALQTTQRERISLR